MPLVLSTERSQPHINITIELSIDHLLTAMLGAIALLLLHALQKRETSLPKLNSASATRSLHCWLHMEECMSNGESAREHEERSGVLDALLIWLTCVLCVVL